MRKVGLGILYETREQRASDQKEIEGGGLMGYLRERYWLKLAQKSREGDKGYINASMFYSISRKCLGRKHDDPADDFSYWSWAGSEGSGSHAGWAEVVEVFVHNNGQQVNDVMRHRNSIRGGSAIDINDFEESIDLGNPRRELQSEVADRVIREARRKIAKSSYKKVYEEYGKGCLVIGLPLWFATPPMEPQRHENVLDNFWVRTHAKLQCVKREFLDREDCPFDKIVVVWETTTEAIRDWAAGCDWTAYGDPANVQSNSLISVLSMIDLYRILEKAEEDGWPLLGVCIRFAVTVDSDKRRAETTSKWKKSRIAGVPMVSVLESV